MVPKSTFMGLVVVGLIACSQLNVDVSPDAGSVDPGGGSQTHLDAAMAPTARLGRGQRGRGWWKHGANRR
jgi:hypothetical protein